DWAMDGLALGLEGLGFIANPPGALAGSAVGFLIEHLSFLKEPLDDLAGDPDAIFGVAAVWGSRSARNAPRSPRTTSGRSNRGSPVGKVTRPRRTGRRPPRSRNRSNRWRRRSGSRRPCRASGSWWPRCGGSPAI